MTKLTDTTDHKPTEGGTLNIVKDHDGSSRYYVTRTQDGKIVERTRVIVPASTNLFFRRTKRRESA